MARTVVKRTNQLGIPAIQSISVSLSSTRETFTFREHINVSDYFQGYFTAWLSGSPTAPSTPVPVYFNTEGLLGSDVQVFDPGGTAITTANIRDGVYTMFYDRTTNKLRLMSGLIIPSSVTTTNSTKSKE